MKSSDLAVWNEVPFLFWVKDEEGKYLWGNQAISKLAGEDVAGKSDDDLVWSADADKLRDADKRVLESGEPLFLQESVHDSSRGKATLNVCKWRGELDGSQRCFGVSFEIA